TALRTQRRPLPRARCLLPPVRLRGVAVHAPPAEKVDCSDAKAYPRSQGAAEQIGERWRLQRRSWWERAAGERLDQACCGRSSQPVLRRQEPPSDLRSRVIT